jgi:hypothetical protein
MPPLTQEKVNNENMSLKDLSVAAAPPQVSAEGQAAAGRIAAARAAKDAVGTVAPSDLKPQAVVNVPQPAIPTQGASISAELEEGVDQFTQQRIDDKESKAGTKESALDTYLTNLTQQKGLTQLTDEAYRAEGGVDAITPELNDINDKIRKEQLALRRAKESIEEKGGGLAGGAATEIANLERDSFRKQADLSIIQLGIQGRYDSAKEAADRAVAAQLEQQTNYNAALKFAYDEAKSDWSVAEQREFETLLGNRNRAIEEETNRLTAIKELGIRAQIEGDAPTDVVQRMMAAETEAEAMAIGGQYIGALDREQQRASIEASRASTANSYDQIRARSVAAREAAQEATSAEQEAQQKKVADTEQALEISNLATDLLSAPGGGAAVGFGVGKLFGIDAIGGTNRADFEAQATRLANLLTLDNLDLMSGVLSETDIKILETAGSNLRNFNMSEAAYIKEVERVNSTMQRTILNNGISEEQAIFYNVLVPEDTQTFNSIWESE